MATLKALNISEIITNILEHFEDRQWKRLRDPSSLVSCAQVNKLWCDHATAILWSQRSYGERAHVSQAHFKALSKMTHARRPIYATKIQYVDDRDFDCTTLEGLEEYHRCFAMIEFPSLREAAIRIPMLANERTRLQYLVSSLRTLKVLDRNKIRPNIAEGVQDGPRCISEGFMLQIRVRYSIPISKVMLSLNPLFLVDCDHVNSIRRVVHI